MQNVKELALLVLRVGLGVMFAAHGWDKVFNTGIDKLAKYFAGINIPAPELSAAYTGWGELIFGILLIVGLATRISALGLMVMMAGAVYFAHLKDGFLSTDGAGYEYPLMLFFALFVFVAFGSGRFGLDALLFKRKAAASAS